MTPTAMPPSILKNPQTIGCHKKKPTAKTNKKIAELKKRISLLKEEQHPAPVTRLQKKRLIAKIDNHEQELTTLVLKAPKMVNWRSENCTIPIPSREELYEKISKSDLFYTPRDWTKFQQDAASEVSCYQWSTTIKTGQFVSFKEAMNNLYQTPSTDPNPSLAAKKN